MARFPNIFRKSSLAIVAIAVGIAQPIDSAPAISDVKPQPISQVPHWKKAYTEHIGKLVGNVFNPFPQGYVGGDMGVSFPVGDRILFTAGDMAPRPWKPTFYDGLAETSKDWNHQGLPHLRFITERAPFLAPPNVNFGCNNGPFEGLAWGGNTYLFYATDWYGGECPKGLGHHTLALVHAQGTDFAHLTTDWKMPVTKFQMVSVVADGGFLWVFGSGQYRKSAIYLARVPIPDIPGPHFLDPKAWRFYDGHGGFTIDDERKAEPLIQDTCVGELSVRRHPQLGIWLMTSGNCLMLGPKNPDRGFVLRTATSPTGPWSDPYAGRSGVIWSIASPGQHDDPGYTTFMHASNYDPRFLSDDGLSGYGQEREWAGEYGPQMIPEFFTHDGPGVYSLYYTTSSWNPYVTHLMRTVMVEDGYPVPVPQEKGLGFPPANLENSNFAHGTAGWAVRGQPPHIANGSATIPPRSAISQVFVVDAATKSLKFQVTGDAGGKELSQFWNISALLVDDGTGNILRRTWPIGIPLDAKGKPLPPVAGSQNVQWNLVPLKGERVRLIIANDEDKGSITAWGFDMVRTTPKCVGPAC